MTNKDIKRPAMSGKLLAAAMLVLPLALVVWVRGYSTSLYGLAESERDALTAAAFSDDGTKLITGDSRGHLRIVKIKSGEAGGETSAAHLGEVYRVAWHPNGLALSLGRDGRAFLWQSDARSDPLPLGRTRIQRWGAAFSPDGTMAYLGGGQPNLSAWETASGSPAAEVQEYAFWLDSLAASPGGKYLASASNAQPSLLLWRLPGLELELTSLAHVGGIRALDWSPNGRLLASGGSEDGNVVLWSVEGRGGKIESLSPRAVFEGLQSPVDWVAFSASSEILAAADSSSAPKAWRLPPEPEGGAIPIELRSTAEISLFESAAAAGETGRPLALFASDEGGIMVIRSPGTLERWQETAAR